MLDPLYWALLKVCDLRGSVGILGVQSVSPRCVVFSFSASASLHCLPWPGTAGCATQQTTDEGQAPGLFPEQSTSLKRSLVEVHGQPLSVKESGIYLFKPLLIFFLLGFAGFILLPNSSIWIRRRQYASGHISLHLAVYN